ncbi:tryptophan--tRNA ligase [Patescibacteria group bacterium]|nr:tryptophan--tRNA ligase [Patescibacteria group bacterium]
MSTLLVSGAQPTNNLHLGNYIGALKQWVELERHHDCLFMIVDLHAITVPQDPIALRQNTLDLCAAYLGAGLDPEKSTLFVQSEVPEHAELAWILSSIAKMGEMERMTQYKDKSVKQGENVSLALFSYPVLMAADILLYGAGIVPVGEDQTQHLELARDLAERFNTRFGETFFLPKAFVQTVGARIMGLDDPTKKMSKSASSANNYIALSDDADTIRKKIMRAVTDTDSVVHYDPEHKPAISNLLTIYHHMTGEQISVIESRFVGKGYGDFKKDLAEVIIQHIAPITAKMNEFKNDPTELHRILDRGRDKARALAAQKMALVRERVGVGRRT